MQTQQQDTYAHSLNSIGSARRIINQRRYFFSQKIHTYKTGTGNDQSDSEGRPGFGPDAENIIQCPRFRNRRYQADRHSRREDSR